MQSWCHWGLKRGLRTITIVGEIDLPVLQDGNQPHIVVSGEHHEVADIGARKYPAAVSGYRLLRKQRRREGRACEARKSMILQKR